MGLRAMKGSAGEKCESMSKVKRPGCDSKVDGIKAHQTTTTKTPENSILLDLSGLN